MILGQVSYKSVQNFLKPIPCDLQIICEDKKVFSSHKLLFGLLNTTLENIFLEEDFANENITLFLPIKSELLDSTINDEFGFGLKRKIEESSLYRICNFKIHCFCFLLTTEIYFQKKGDSLVILG